MMNKNVNKKCLILHCEQAKFSYVLVALDKMLFSSPTVLIFFLFLHENIYCGYSLEAPRRGTSNQ